MEDDEEKQPFGEDLEVEESGCLIVSDKRRLVIMEEVRKKREGLLWLVLGLLSFGLMFSVPAIVEWQFRHELVMEVDLSKKGTTFKSFTKSSDDQPVIYSIYYFDLQNGEDVLADKGGKPVVVQRGPYAYDELFEYFDIDFEQEGQRMNFFSQKYYRFNKEKSCVGCDDEKDTILTVDVVAIELLELLATFEVSPSFDQATFLLLKSLLASLLCDTRHDLSPFTRKTVHEAHWGRWQDPTLEAAQKLLMKFNMTKEALLLSNHVPGFETNYTSQKLARTVFGKRDQVKTKAGKSMRYSKYAGSPYVRACLSPTVPANEEEQIPSSCEPQDERWDNLPEEEGEALAKSKGWTLAYGSRYASRAKGSSPTFVKPLKLNRGKFGKGLFFANHHKFTHLIKTIFFDAPRAYAGHQNIHLFIDSIYRQLKFSKTHKDGHVFRRGLLLERYELDRGQQLMATSNSIYDQFTTPYGILNLTRAVGFPVLASQPHFFDSDASLQNLVVGLNPRRELHNTYIDVEPRSGQVFTAQERLQFNAVLFNYDLSPTRNSDCTKRGAQWTAFPKRVNNNTLNHDGFLFPIGYIDQGYRLNSDDVALLQSELKTIDYAADFAFLFFCLAAFLCFARTLYLFLIYYPTITTIKEEDPGRYELMTEGSDMSSERGHSQTNNNKPSTDGTDLSSSSNCCPCLFASNQQHQTKNNQPPPQLISI